MSEKPETYAEQMARKRGDKPRLTAVERAESHPVLKALPLAVMLILFADVLAFWIVLGGIIFGPLQWSALFWPIGIAVGAVVLALLIAVVFGLIDGFLNGK